MHKQCTSSSHLRRHHLAIKMMSYFALSVMAASLLPAATATQAQRVLSQAGDGSSPLTDSVTVPTPDFAAYNTANPAQCSMRMAGCTGMLSTLEHDVAGQITVIDDCTFRVRGWEYDGTGPAVEWWAAPVSSATPAAFDYAAGVYIATIQDTSGEDVAGAHACRSA